jgi:hypothetical protein
MPHRRLRRAQKSIATVKNVKDRKIAEEAIDRTHELFLQAILQRAARCKML